MKTLLQLITKFTLAILVGRTYYVPLNASAALTVNNPFFQACRVPGPLLPPSSPLLLRRAKVPAATPEAKATPRSNLLRGESEEESSEDEDVEAILDVKRIMQLVCPCIVPCL